MRRVPVGAWLLLSLAVATLVSGGAVAALEPAVVTDGAASGTQTEPAEPVLSLHEQDSGAAASNQTNGTASAGNGTTSAEREAASEYFESAATRRQAVADGERLVESCAAEPPEGYRPPVEGDAIGWVNGYWYDEPLELDPAASLEGQELHALTARTAARVEALRCHDFEVLPPLRLENASELSARQAALFENRSDAARQIDAARLEAGLLVGTETDPAAARAATTGAAARGAYDPATNTITLVGAEGNATRVDEVTLAHELVHALQDQHHDLSSFDAQRIDEDRAETALIEGDAVVVERRYEQRCEDEQWTDPCHVANPPAGGDDGSLALSLLLYQPYNDGPILVERAYDDGGWAAVDEYFEDPPTSTAQVLSPSGYEQFERSFVRIDESISPEWTRIRPDDAPANDVLGPGAIASALLAPTFEGHPNPIYDPKVIQRSARQTDDPYRTYDYRLDAVDGWAGDRLIAYENQRGETGSLWASTWRTADDAAQFRDRYEELLEVRGARPVDGHQSTYRFRDTSDYEGAVYVYSDGTDILVAHGPDVDALQALYAGAAPEPRGSVASSGAEPGPSSELPADELPGPRIATALFALLVAVVATYRWRRPS